MTGRRLQGQQRAALFGVAAGVTFGLTAALMKSMTGQLSRGHGHPFVSWRIYTMAVVGISGVFLAQNALQAGPEADSGGCGVLPASAASPVFSGIRSLSAMPGANIRAWVEKHNDNHTYSTQSHLFDPVRRRRPVRNGRDTNRPRSVA